jgi:hypothetical protein
MAMASSFCDFSKQKPRPSILEYSITGRESNISLIDINDSFSNNRTRPSSAAFKYQIARPDIMIKRESYFQGCSPSKEAVLPSGSRGCI